MDTLAPLLSSNGFARSIVARLLVGYTVVILLLGLTWGAGAYSVGQIDARISHTVDVDDAILSNITERVKLLDDEETGLRGYVLTARPDFLVPYTHAVRLLPHLRVQGAALVAGLPATRVLLASATVRARAWEAWARNLLRHQPRDPRSSGAILAQIEGKHLFDRVRSAASSVVRAVTLDRRHDLDQSRRIVSLLNVLAAGIFILALLATLLVGWLTMRAIMRPLTGLRRAADTIGSGNLDRAIVVQGAREFADLARSMDRMRLQLALAHAELEHRALHDPLTGLPNRVLLEDRLEQAIHIARRDGASMALFLIDLDGFKEVNDTLGHEAGDVLLAEVSRRLRGALRESDTVSRLGGDEFAVVLPAVDVERAAHMAQKVQCAIAPPLTFQNREITVGGSIGISLFPAHGQDPGTLLRHADVAMYAAKRDGAPYRAYSEAHDRQVPLALFIGSQGRRSAVS